MADKNTKNTSTNESIGYVVGGGLKANLLIRLTVPAFSIQEGSFVVVKSGNWQFYGIATDLQLGATDPRFADDQMENRLPSNIALLLHGQTLYTNLVVLPSLMLESGPKLDSPEYTSWRKLIDNGKKEEPHPIPVKTVPVHHAKAFLANKGNIAEIFGKESAEGNFVIGHTREQKHPVCINLDKLIQRSSGIFGATGSGKSFLTRIILAGLIDRNQSSVLIYDMHNEYGLDDIASDTGQNIIGLRSAFGREKVQIVGLGSSADIRGTAPDFNLTLSYDDIMPEDIELLVHELNLRETTATTLDALVQQFGRSGWFSKFKSMKYGKTVEQDGKRVPSPDSVAYWANKNGIHEQAAKGLHSKLGRLFNKAYIIKNPPADSIQAVIDSLKSGHHIVLSFGKYESDLDYLLISNLLTRRIRDEWKKMTNQFRNGKSAEPRQLVITVEEAHKLLNREMASQTTFSTIAREMRKYYVTLLIIDQRPSQIYDEVMSQLGTRICGWLGDDDDTHAVLSGLAGREALRGMLARLQPKEEVLLLGWGVPMPILVRSRRYDANFYKSIKHSRNTNFDQKAAINTLYPD
ncbi:MAG: ATP-binding protein [Anaerolineaceae bacterium]|nr:ATP-binding protein [Anaerolineaceae bacterium]